MVGCQNRHSAENRIEYIDSLKISLENTALKVALINLVQENNVRPYSIFLDNYLIVLNKRDSFYAFNTNRFERDSVFENKLNIKGFKRAFTAFDDLYGIDENNQAFRYERRTAEWIESDDLPFSNSTPIYENDKYICYSICHGEFGGYVFFYNKQTKRTTFVRATCAVSLIEQQSGGFYIASSLSHMVNSSYIKNIEDPDLLSKVPDTSRHFDNYWDKISLYDSIILADTTITDSQISDFLRIDENGNVIQRPQYVFDTWGDILITAGFKIKGENYFITDYHSVRNASFHQETRLTKLHNDSLVVINTADTIFSGLPYSNGGITRKVKDNIILDYTQSPNRTEYQPESKYRNLLLTTFIITDTTLIRINWIDWEKEQE